MCIVCRSRFANCASSWVRSSFLLLRLSYQVDIDRAKRGDTFLLKENSSAFCSTRMFHLLLSWTWCLLDVGRHTLSERAPLLSRFTYFWRQRIRITKSFPQDTSIGLIQAVSTLSYVLCLVTLPNSAHIFHRSMTSQTIFKEHMTSSYLQYPRTDQALPAYD